ncbi:3-oxoacyl-ACP synthase [Acidovorax sp. SUPP2825]|uniref:3-oxoacyl-ACP synthase n=1 Tax=Acidovorax sp. SUPP2825 TaxID=2920879 RepID=UPI0023DE51A3|nr:3-oxoacyl-ACP synthase [Acidovorax sp. SUPP2825]GKS94668.1 3-oxoacyl-ACP synthase [Acidovorax sp. SUPP2825]
MTPLTIAATGACTPIGTRAWQTRSAVASRFAAFTRQPITGHIDHQATVSRVQAIEADCTGIDRLIRLAAPALHEALQGPTTAPTAAWPMVRPIPVFIALPEPLPELRGAIDAQRFALELPRALDVAPEFLPLMLYTGGAVAGADALAAAYRFMQEHPSVPEVVCGGVDSGVDPATIDVFHQRRWLRVKGHTEGFIASEGAAFVRLARKPCAANYVTVFPPAFAQEPASRVGSEAILDGAALIGAATHALKAADIPAQALQSYWSDMDGSPWRGSELMNLSAHLAAQHGHPAMHDPAAFLGEVGAAWVPLLLSLLHEMRQGLHHPHRPVALSGHAGLQSVTGLGTRVAAWVATWNHTRAPIPSPSTRNREAA